jgi:phage tail-like protein
MAEAACSDKFAQVRGFRVEIDGPTGKQEDNAWETVLAGELLVATTGAPGRFQTTSPGHKSIEEITLRGPLTAKRAAVTRWINDSFDHKHARRTVTISPLGADGRPLKTFVYQDCFLTTYVYPRLDAADPRTLMEEVRFVFGRETVLD